MLENCSAPLPGCAWTVQSLWAWMDWIGHADLIVLGLMLAYVVSVAIHVSYRLAQEVQSSVDDWGRRQLAADLGVEVAVVRSIVIAAPYLGLVGACFGILGAFTGIDVLAESGFAAVAPRVPLGFVTTAAGTLVTIAATCVSRYLSSRIESFRSKCFTEKAPAGNIRASLEISATKANFGFASVNRRTDVCLSGRGVFAVC
jgi:hypothetical protein